MFLFIPLALIVAACAAVIVVAWRKWPYVQRLSPDSHELPVNAFAGFFPEVRHAMHRIASRQWRDALYDGLIKVLQAIRNLFSRIDTATTRLVARIRTKPAVAPQPAQVQPARPLSSPPETLASPGIGIRDIHVKSSPAKSGRVSYLKREEQRLIIEIARKPKDGSLYEKLGDTYIKMGEFSDARESFRMAKKFQSDSKRIDMKLSFVAEKLQESSKHPSSPA